MMLAGDVRAQVSSENDERLKAALKQFPDADANHDGVLTMQEARAYLRGMRNGAGAKVGAATRPSTSPAAGDAAVMNSDAFKLTAAELDRLMQADTAKGSKEPLSFPKGNGLRILMTGHSWVAPARISLPKIAAAAGLDGHHQRTHTSGGMSGSAQSIWLSEIGKFNGQPAKTILLPAIATGQWDVMTWGAFYGDKPEHYERWIDLCLKYNPKMVFYIQDGWPVYSAEMEKLSTEEKLKAIDSQAAEIQATLSKSLYEALNAKYPGKVHVLPCGDAVLRMLHLYFQKQLPDFDCVSENLGGKKGIYRDGGHLSTNSGMGQLAGYVYYATLYKRSPELIEGGRPEGVSDGIDRIMRKVAWLSVINSPYSGVTDKNGDGIAD
jgi:hypothetical protein